jgi:hypothetical protein
MATMPELSTSVRQTQIERSSLGRRYAAAMWAMLGLFVLRVVGQVLVAFFGVAYLPAMPEWYSGLLPYPILLRVQCLIIVLFTWICIDVTRGRGTFAYASAQIGTFLTWFSAIYAFSMLARYAITMAIHPERRWFGTGTIPIFFHLVLASYLFLFSRFHLAMGEPLEK